MSRKGEKDIYPAKILLIGEYGIVLGGSGFSVPYHDYSGSLQFYSGDKQFSQEYSMSSQSICQLLKYMIRQNYDFEFIDLESMRYDYAGGLWFCSDIPMGYGLGSSGALVAALYARYRLSKTTDIREIRNHLSLMESYFHGSSSGIDPCVSFLNEPLLFNDLHAPKPLSGWIVEKAGLHIWLVDTGQKEKTIRLVDWFKAKMVQDEFRFRTEEDYLRTNQKIIEDIQQGNPISIADIRIISRYQLDYLSLMIPDGFRKHFLAGMSSCDFAFKLCGSGGGGYMLCYSTDDSVTMDYFEKEGLKYRKL